MRSVIYPGLLHLSGGGLLGWFQTGFLGLVNASAKEIVVLNHTEALLKEAILYS